MALNEYGRLTRVALRHARTAFRDQATLAAQWRALNYHAQPDYAAAAGEYDAFLAIFQSRGCAVELLPDAPELTPDALYVRDATLVSPRGLIHGGFGKPARRAENAANGAALTAGGLPVAGAITGGGTLEGGDVVWLDERTLCVGEGYRSNAEGIRQLRAILGPAVHVEVTGLPHYKGPSDVFHLMSILSPLDRDLALVYSPLMPVPFRNFLLARGLAFVEVPDEEFASIACNVLALAPRDLLMVEGNPLTRRRLEAAGCRVTTYAGQQISRLGEGGPTCLTRPLERA